MLIIDLNNGLYQALENAGLGIEDFFASLKTCDFRQFSELSLEERKGVALVNLAALQGVRLTDEVLARFLTFEGIIIFKTPEASVELVALAEQLSEMTDKVVMTEILPLSKIATTHLKGLFKMLWRQDLERERFKEQMVRFSQEMDELIRSAQQDIHRAKKIHEDVVPRRMEELKGITLYSKYAVGEGAGSEYFDVIKGAFHSHLIFLHTNSYLASSCLMGLLNKFKDRPDGLDMDLFLQEAGLEIKALNAHKKRPIQIELLVMRLEHGTFKCEGFSFGAFELFSQKTGFIPKGTVASFDLEKLDRARFSFRLDKGEKVVVFSPGFIFNWDEQRQESSRDGLVGASTHLTPPEILMELFFRLKKQSSGDFLAKDATAVIMEVSRHAIQQV